MSDRDAVCRFLLASAAISSAQQTVISDRATSPAESLPKKASTSTRMSVSQKATKRAHRGTEADTGRQR